jgi:hypothetical protein
MYTLCIYLCMVALTKLSPRQTAYNEMKELVNNGRNRLWPVLNNYICICLEGLPKR